MTVTDDGVALLALAVTTAAHLGFQLTISLLVYPALARVEPEQWTAAHDAHSRAIVPLVGLLYGSMVVAAAWALTTSPTSVWLVGSVTAVAATMLVTTTLAAPAHGRMTGAREPGEMTRLQRVDWVRSALAAAACATAVGAALVG